MGVMWYRCQSNTATDAWALRLLRVVSLSKICDWDLGGIHETLGRDALEPGPETSNLEISIKLRAYTIHILLLSVIRHSSCGKTEAPVARKCDAGCLMRE
jgi:hypothetical protein